MNRLWKMLKTGFSILGYMLLVAITFGSVALFSWLSRVGFDEASIGTDGGYEFGYMMLAFAACMGGIAFETLRPQRIA